MDGERIAISKIVDLVEVLPDRIRVVDYETDRSRGAAEEYRKQLSVYYHVLDAWCPERDVEASIRYTYEGESVAVEPISQTEVRELLAESAE